MEQEKSVLSQRRKPSQDRSKATCEAILQAAAHILEEEGDTAFTSNRIAERAGVSIGSLYQYFPNKKAILFALAMEEESRLPCRTVLESRSEAQSESQLRLGIRAYINMLAGNPKTRKAALNTVLHERGPIEVGRQTDERFEASGAFTGLSPIERFTLSRAIVGVVQSAVQEERSDITSRDFEDALVQLSRSFVKTGDKQTAPNAGSGACR